MKGLVNIGICRHCDSEIVVNCFKIATTIDDEFVDMYDICPKRCRIDKRVISFEQEIDLIKNVNGVKNGIYEI